MVGRRPAVGRIEAIPQKAAGMRSEPPISLPSPSGEPPAAMTAASPPLLPPQDLFQIPRIVGASVQRIVGFGEDHELRQVGLGDRDRAGRAQRRDIGIVSAFDHIAARRQAECRCRAGKIETFLDSDRQAGERTEFLAARQGLVDVRRGLLALSKRSTATALSLRLTALSRAMKCSTVSLDDRSPAAMRRVISRTERSCS